MRIAMIAGNAAWFGGLFRLVGEAVAKVVPGIGPTAEQQRTAVLVILVTLIIFGVEVVLLRRWSWYRGVVRQSQADIRSLYGLAPTGSPPSSLAPGRPATQVAVVFVAALVAALLVAAVLPGVIAAVVAMIVGLVLRVAVVTIAATS
jgi:hypothetical protein